MKTRLKKMRLVGLISGGKDSVYNMLQCIAAGHEIVAVANIEPNKKEELDSYMYQSVGHQVVSLIAGALALPIYRQKTKGRAICKTKTYMQTSHDEVEDLLELLIKVKKDIQIDGVSVGAIASDYQRTRVENVCRRLNLKCFAYLWRRNQEELLQEMIDSELDAIIIKIASIGLNPEEHLGMHIRDIKQYLIELNKKFGVNVCGEGGEYETITLDCPLFHRFIDITDSENTILSNDAFAPVAFLNIKNASLKEKFWIAEDPVESLQTRLAHIRSIVKNPYSYVQDCVDEVSLTIFPQRPKKVLSGDLPFPFGNEIKADDQQSSSVQEYWKKPILQKPHSSQKVSFSPASVLSVDSTTCNLHYSTGWCCLGNVSGQTLSDAFSYLQKHLERIKYGFEDVIFVNLFVKDMAEFNSMNKIYSDFMPNILPPARVCVETQLPPETGVIISMVAHKLVSKSQKVIYSTQSQEKEVMHVQSISHWAPANIGPYSQCVKVGGIYYLAGQIPLIPGTMEILNKPILHQCRLSLRHVLRVIEAMNDKLGFSNIIQAICYVISEEIGGDIPSLWSYITNNENATITTVVVSALPKNAQLEWEVLVCSYDNPQVDEEVEVVDEFYLQLKRCVYKDPYTSSIVCNVSNAKKGGKSQKNLKILTHEGVSAILKHCLQFLRGDTKNITSPLCILKLFYKANETVMATIISDIIKSPYDSKVVATGIPIIACQEPHIFLTITGVCH